jgi:1,4-alpha-glucan branching enzyme
MLGANVEQDGVRFTVWAPKIKQVEVVIEHPGQSIGLDPIGDGMHERLVSGIGPGARYRFRLDGDGPFPDPRGCMAHQR